MKTKIYLLFFALAFIFAGCRDDKDDDGGKSIVLPNSGDSTQEALADEKSTGSGFTFTAKSNWTAMVSETTPKARDTESAGGTATETGNSDKVTWLKLLYNGSEKYSGGAGTFVLEISLEPNYTGNSRSAKIEIVCGNDKITISVTQEAVDGKGDVPEDPNPVTSITLSETNLSLNIGESEQLFATVQPSNATIQTVVWSSSNLEVATVDSEGVITAIAPGSTIITVKSSVYEDITATCELKIIDNTQPKPKLITSIAMEGYNLQYREEYTQFWEISYDEQNRVVRYEEISDEYALYTFEYPSSNQIIFKSYDKGDGDEPQTIIATLNNSGYITQTKYHNSDNYLYRFTYNNGYLNQRISEYERHINDDKPWDDPIYSTEYTYMTFNWGNNNLLNYIYTYSYNNETYKYPSAGDYVFTNHANDKCNVDLNIFLMDTYYGDNHDIFALFNLLGTRSKNLIDGDYAHLDEYYSPHQPGMESYDEKKWKGTMNVDYTFDDEGYVTEINTTVDWIENTVIIATGERIFIDEYSHKYKYVITYNQ